MHPLRPACLKTALWLCSLFFSISPLWAADPDPPLDGFIDNGGFVTTVGGSILDAHRENECFIPASTIKIITALAAIKILGPSYRFKTEFYLEGESQLLVRGYGDPFLTSEYIRKIGKQLKARGIDRLDGITVDDSAFSLENTVDGSTNTSNPYDAPNGALIVNFNSLPVVCNRASITSGEPQTPLLPLMKEICKRLPAGSHRVNVSAFSTADAPDCSLNYSCELFSAIFREQGISIGEVCLKGTVTSKAVHVYTYFSEKNLEDMISACFEYSNNFLANQLFLTCGAAVSGYPATWEKARHCMQKVLSEDLGIDITGMSLHEGSGLSMNNRISPSFMVSVLQAFKPFSHLLPVKDTILVKSGTMSGIFCYAGYFTSKDQIDPFVIFLNQEDNTRKDVLATLYKKYLASGSHPHNSGPR